MIGKTFAAANPLQVSWDTAVKPRFLPFPTLEWQSHFKWGWPAVPLF